VLDAVGVIMSLSWSAAIAENLGPGGGDSPAWVYVAFAAALVGFASVFGIAGLFELRQGVRRREWLILTAVAAPLGLAGLGLSVLNDSGPWSYVLFVLLILTAARAAYACLTIR